ncbi:MAG: hypothetical protein KDK76_03735, partial [Chlamydiia bacterium]|nr:hypothetical protein [Chlamydiia bacterium]
MEIKTLSDKKIEQEKDLAVRPVFPFYSRSKNLLAHVEKMRGVLLSHLPRPFPFSDKKSLAAWIEKTIPWITWSTFESPPDTVTLFFLIPPLSSLPTETFISEMIKRWLLPHQETKMLSFEHMEFFFELHPRESFFIAEASVLIKDRQEATLLKENLPLLKKEILSALSGRKFAPALLETKILPLDHKMNLIREGFIKLVSKFPDDLDETLFERLAFMQAYASKEFREERSYRHLARIILTFILLRSHLKRELNAFPEKRHMKIRFMPTSLTFPFGTKPVLGLSIGLNFFHQYELFNEKHVLRAVQELYPYMRIVPGSTFRSNPLNGPVTMLYVEIEKEDGSQISLEERKTLKESLEEELKKRIEHLVPALFVVRNEEETMRNILMLSRELKSRDDLPQMMISFDQHSKDDLVFTVVLLRVKKEGMPSIQELLKNKDQRIRFILDRVQNVNFIDQSHPIEANVFRLQMAKLHSFLRMDFSVNLYVARDEIVKFLTEHIGEIRDYNGGMMIKQGEILTQFKRLFSDVSSRNQEILENFFYSLNPIESQATISLQYLSLFFELFVKMTEKHQTGEKACEIEHEKDDDITVMILRSTDPDYRPIVEEAIAKAAIRDRAVISSMLTIENSHYFSLLYEDTESAHHDLFRSSVQQALKRWQEKKNQLQVLRIPYIDILSIDPRVGGDKESAVFIRLFFDGLMRNGKEGKPECAVAKTYELSDDHKTYTFHLRESYWSNGDPVTAYDFEYAWKKVLSPSFETPFAYVFYPIKNGRKAKEGIVSLDEVGIRPLDNHTLVIELEHPAPYFIELTANTLYMPVNRLVDKAHPNWATQRGESFVCNGPFKWKTTSESAPFLELQKNSQHWNQKRIEIDHIQASQMNLTSAVQMFNTGKLDLIGSNLCSSG